jgi:hypothetical protein
MNMIDIATRIEDTLELDCGHIINVRRADVTMYGKLNAVGIHLLDPSEHELSDALNVAARDLYPTVFVYRNHPENNGE